MEFKDNYKPIPAARTQKKIKPVAVFRTKINQTRKALKGFTKSLKTDKDSLVQFQNTRKNLFRGFLGPSFMIQTDRIVETIKLPSPIKRKVIKTSTNQLILIAEHKS